MARKPAKKSRTRTRSKLSKPPTNPAPDYKVTGDYSPEARAAILKRVKARHSPVTIQGTIERPDFHVTTDIRATSDLLWQHLATFRRWLVEGGTYTPAEWQCLLIDIRLEAHEVGLRPCFANVEWIAAALQEAREGDPNGPWADEVDSWSKMILTACGPAGSIELHDLLDGFADTGIPAELHKRESAIEWAESWMNARERQLAKPAAVSVSPELLDQLQRAAAAVDLHAIDRAAERAAEKIARVFGAGDNGDAMPKTLLAGADEPAGPALTVNQSRVLRAMARFDASQLPTVAMIAKETVDPEASPPVPALSDEGVRQCVVKLIESSLAERPEGVRSGARLTKAGRKLAGKIAD